MLGDRVRPRRASRRWRQYPFGETLSEDLASQQASQRKRRAITRGFTTRPASGRSVTHRRYRLWIRRETVPRKELEAFANYVIYARQRATARSDLTRVMLARSREQLEQSRKLLDELPLFR